MIHIVCSLPQWSVLSVSSFCIRRTVPKSFRSMVWIFICFANNTQLYHHCLHDEMSCSLNDALRQSAIGCLQTALSWILIRQSCCGQVRSTANCHWAAGACLCADWFRYCHSVGPCLRALRDLLVWPQPGYCKHVSSVCAACFYWLCQFPRVQRSLGDESTKTLVHAVVTARVDYCNMVLAGAPRSVTDWLQWVFNAAARLVGGMCKYDHGLSELLHTDLHCLDVADRVWYKLTITVHRCLHNKAPKYLTDCCVAVSDIAGH